MNKITTTLQCDHLILEALKEDISSEDVSTNAVMKEYTKGEVDLICKQDGIIAGLDVFRRVFELLDEDTQAEFYCKDGDEVKKGQLMGKSRRHPGPSLRRARCAELSPADERDRYLYTFCCRAAEGHQDEAS